MPQGYIKEVLYQFSSIYLPGKCSISYLRTFSKSRHPTDIPQTSHRHLQGTRHANRQQQTPINTARHTQTAPVSVLGCLAVSVGVCWHVVFPGDVWGVSAGCLGCVGVSEWCSWKSEALGCFWGVSGFSVLAVWSQDTILAQH